MKLRERFRRLTIWNKIGAVGGVASIIALPVAVGLWYWPRPISTPQPLASDQGTVGKTPLVVQNNSAVVPRASEVTRTHASTATTKASPHAVDTAQIAQKLDQIERNTRPTQPAVPTVHVCIDGQQAEAEYQTYLNMTTDTPVQNAAFKFVFDKPVTSVDVGSSMMPISYGSRLIDPRTFEFRLSLPESWLPSKELQVVVRSVEVVGLADVLGGGNEKFEITHQHPCPDPRTGPQK